MGVCQTSLKDSNLGTCPVAQWLRICLAMQGAGLIPVQGSKVSHAAEQLNLHCNENPT